MHSLARLIEPGRKSPRSSNKSSIRGIAAHPEVIDCYLEIANVFVVTVDWLSPQERGQPMPLMLRQ